MSDVVDGFHHVGLITHSMTAATDRYERLGFRFTPLSLPRIPLTDSGIPEELGVGNRTAIFRHNYLEVLAVTDPVRWSTIGPSQRGPYDIDIPLTRYEGLHVMHFNADNIEALQHQLVANKVDSGPIRPFQRMVDTSDGPQTMRALALSFPPNQTPEALIQVAQHLTPQLVLQPRYQAHPNGATDITAVTVCSATPAEYASKYQAMTGRPAIVHADRASVDLRTARIDVLSPETISRTRPDLQIPAVPSLVEIVVSVTNLKKTAELLDSRDIPTIPYEQTLTVPATEACGATVTFAQGRP